MDDKRELPQELVDLIQHRSTEYEIETVTILKGPLATTLVKEAERRGKEPVALLADLVEAVLIGRLFQQVLDGKSFAAKDGLDAVIEADLAEGIEMAAEARGVSGKSLVSQILKAVVEDDLFAAVLDR